MPSYRKYRSMRAGMIPTYQAAQGRQPGRGKSWPCHRTGRTDPWGREWRPPCWSDRTWLTTGKGLTIKEKLVSHKNNFRFLCVFIHNTISPKFRLAKFWLKLKVTVFAKAQLFWNILLKTAKGSKKQNCGFWPCWTEPKSGSSIWRMDRIKNRIPIGAYYEKKHISMLNWA